jgi:hypothetical protein
VKALTVGLSLRATSNMSYVEFQYIVTSQGMEFLGNFMLLQQLFPIWGGNHRGVDDFEGEPADLKVKVSHLAITK